jgi:hypothetical protein
MVYFYTLFDSFTNVTVESVEMGSQKWDSTPGSNEYYPPTQRCLPSPCDGPTSSNGASIHAIGMAIMAAGTLAAHGKSVYCSTMSLTRPLMLLSHNSSPLPNDRGSTMPVLCYWMLFD